MQAAALWSASQCGQEINKDLAPKLGKDGENLVHTYIKIDGDNTITAVIPHSEMGQGVHTALGQMLAEELDADWDELKLKRRPRLVSTLHTQRDVTFLPELSFPRYSYLPWME